MNVTRISIRHRSLVLSERFYVTVYFCRIVLYWTNDRGEPRQRAFFHWADSERKAYFGACEYMAAWLSGRLEEWARKAEGA